MMDEKRLSDLGRDAERGLATGPMDTLDLIGEVRRLQAVALTYEDEADRVGVELRAERNAVRILREELTKPEADCERPATCCLHKDGEG